MNVAELLEHKSDAVYTCAPHKAVRQALAMLAEHNIGALVVTDKEALVGIISERDIVRGLAEHGAAVLESPVSEVMTSRVQTCEETTAVDDIMGLMTTQRMRHVPVVREGRLVGLVSIGDVVKARLGVLESEKRELLEYVSGR